MKQHIYEIHRLTWQEIEIEVRYCRESFAGYAHIEIESVCRSPLPVTETGYRSHFTRPEVIAEYGGPLALVEAMLAAYAKDKNWRQSETERKQLSLF